MTFMKRFMLILAELFITISVGEMFIVSMQCFVMIFNKWRHFLQGKFHVSSSNSNTISSSLGIMSISLSRSYRFITFSSAKFCKYNESRALEKYDTCNHGDFLEKSDPYFSKEMWTYLVIDNIFHLPVDLTCKIYVQLIFVSLRLWCFYRL